MNEKEEFALVPRSPGLEKRKEPGVKRILSGMVADTLALAKKEPLRKSRRLRIVMVNDEQGVLESFSIIIRGCFKGVALLTFANGAAALEELSKPNPPANNG